MEEQAKYFKLSVPQTLQLGDLAKRFTNERLSHPFTVRTCLQDALGRSAQERFYAFIETDAGDLAELLVANGMARVHGSIATPVGLNSPQREREKLDRLEREAKVARVGGWGAATGRMSARLLKQPPKKGADSFDAFFHPERLTGVETNVNASDSLRRSAPAPSPSIAPETKQSAGAKLDPNTASSEELLALPGLGPVLVSRIIAARPFTSADDLQNVKGIGAKKFSQIRPFFAPAPAGPDTAR